MNLSRRSFLSRGSLGFALAGALAAVPGLASVLRLPIVSTSPQGGLAEPLVAHVRDVNSGEIALMVGTKRVIQRDVDLAARLYAAASAAIER